MAKDPLATAVNKAEPDPQTTPRVRPSEFGISGRGMSRAAARAEDEDDARAESISRRNRATPAFNKGGMVKAGSPKVSAPCKDSKTIKCY